MDAAEAKKCLKLICKTFGLEVKTEETWYEKAKEFKGFTMPKLKPICKPDLFTAWLEVIGYPQSLLNEANSDDLCVDNRIYSNDHFLVAIVGFDDKSDDRFTAALISLCEALQCTQLYYDDPDKVRAYLQKHTTNEQFMIEKARTKIGEVPSFSSYEELKMKLTLRGDMK